jgi:hypothetical protein
MAETETTKDGKETSDDSADGSAATRMTSETTSETTSGVAQGSCRMQSVYPCTVMRYLFPFAAVAVIAFLLGRLLNSY